MAITFADSFVEVLHRVLARCVSRSASTKTFRRDQVEAWVRARLARRAA